MSLEILKLFKPEQIGFYVTVAKIILSHTLPSNSELRSQRFGVNVSEGVQPHGQGEEL